MKWVGQIFKTQIINLLSQAGSNAEKIGRLHESSIRSRLLTPKNDEDEDEKDIMSLYALVYCNIKARDHFVSENLVEEGCELVCKALEKENVLMKFCDWYYNEARRCEKVNAIIEQRFPFLNAEGEINFDVKQQYMAAKLLNFISGPIKDWQETFRNYRSPSFLLMLFTCIENYRELSSFPPQGVLTMDIPVKLSVTRFSRHIEIGEVNINDSPNAVSHARKRLIRSLLRFQWLDAIIKPFGVPCTYGLIDNIFIFGNEFSSKNVNKKKLLRKKNSKKQYAVKRGTNF